MRWDWVWRGCERANVWEDCGVSRGNIRELWPLAPGGRRRFYHRPWSPCITLWYLIWQCLHLDCTLDAVVKDARNGGDDGVCALPKKLSVDLCSHAITAYSDARQRQSVRWVRHAFTPDPGLLRKGKRLLGRQRLSVVLLDDSTLRVRLHGDLPNTSLRRRHAPGRCPSCQSDSIVGFKEL